MTPGARNSDADTAFVHAAYLQAVANLYGPWTVSALLSSRERKRAIARVASARRELSYLATRQVRDHVTGTRKGVRG
ncbi:hypothetical protein [Actinocorallia aurea]